MAGFPNTVNKAMQTDRVIVFYHVLKCLPGVCLLESNPVCRIPVVSDALCNVSPYPHWASQGRICSIIMEKDVYFTVQMFKRCACFLSFREINFLAVSQ